MSTDVIVGLILNNPTINPYSLIRGYLSGKVIPKSPSSFRIQLWVFLVLCVLMLASTLTTIMLTFRRGGVWFFRLKKGRSKMPYILLHGSLNWLICASIFLATLIGFVSVNIYTSQGNLYFDTVLFDCFVWVPLFWTGCAATAPVVTSYILGRVGNDQEIGKLTEYFYSPYVVNLITVLLPVAFTLSILPIALIASHHYKLALLVYLQIDSQLQIGEKLVKAGAPFSLLDLATGAAAEANLISEFTQYTLWFSRYSLVSFGYLVILLSLLLTFSYLALSSLRQSIILNAKSQSETGLQSKTSQISRHAVKKTWEKMLITLGTIFIAGTAEAISAINAGLSTAHFNLEGDTSSLIRNDILVALYLFIIPAVPIAIIILVRAFDSTSNIVKNKTLNSNSISNEQTKINSTPFPRIDIDEYIKNHKSHSIELEILEIGNVEKEKEVLGNGGDNSMEQV